MRTHGNGQSRGIRDRNPASAFACSSADRAVGVSPPRPSQLAFIVSPSAAVAGMPIKPAVQVAIQDGNGNAITGATGAIIVTFSSNPTGATLSGTKMVLRTASNHHGIPGAADMSSRCG